jgi:hypothetical protein
VTLVPLYTKGDYVPDIHDNEQHKRREEAVRRACKMMGWEYKTSPVFAGIRLVAKGEAVAISLEKLNQFLDTIEGQKIAATAMQMCIDNAMAELQGLDGLLDDRLDNVPILQGDARRMMGYAIEALACSTHNEDEA